MREAWHIVMVLGFSRHVFAKAVPEQRALTWVGMHMEAFRSGGVPRTVLTEYAPRSVVGHLGLRPFSQDEPVDLYDLSRERHERRLMVLTSNRDVGKWYPIFGDPLLASAAVDRLLHHCEIVALEGRPYRTAKAA